MPRRAAAWLALLLPLAAAGCSSDERPEDEVALRFAVLSAPSIGMVTTASGTAEDLLLEAVTELSAVTSLQYVLVPGPVLADATPASRESLLGALGSVAGSVVVALAPGDGPEKPLLEALAKSLAGHSGKAAHATKPKHGWRAVALAPDGTPPPPPPRADEGDDEDDDAPPVLDLVVAARAPASLPGAVVVVPGEPLRLELVGGRALLVVPPLTSPPHVLAVVTVEAGRVSVQLISAVGQPVPPAPAPVQLPVAVED